MVGCAHGDGKGNSNTETGHLLDKESTDYSSIVSNSPIKNGISNIEGDAKCNKDITTASANGQKKLTPRQIILGILIVCITTSAYIQYSMIAPFFPGEALAKGVSTSQTGWIFGIYQLIKFFVAPIYGYNLNKLGARRMFISGAIVCSACMASFGLLAIVTDTTAFIAFCWIIRIVQANGVSLVETSGFAIMAQQFPEHIAMVVGMLEAAGGAGMTMAPSVGGALYSLGGFQLPFFATCGYLSICSVLAMVFMPTIAHVEAVKGQFIDFLKIPGCIIIYIIIVGAAFALTFLDPILTIYLESKFDLDISLVGLVFMVTAIFYCLSSPVIGRITNKGWDGFIVTTGLLCNGLSFFILVSPSPLVYSLPDAGLTGIIIFMDVLGLTSVMALLPSIPLILAHLRYKNYPSDIHTFGLVSGLYGSALALGEFIGPISAGYLDAQFSFAWATTFCSFVLFVLALLMFMYIQIMRKKGVWPLPCKSMTLSS